MLTPFSENNLGPSDPKTRARVEATIPAGRVARTGDVAAAALFLGGEEADYVQAVVLNVDGGLAIFQGRRSIVIAASPTTRRELRFQIARL